MKQVWLDLTIRRPVLMLLLVVLVCSAAITGAKNLYFRGDFRIFFSADNPQMQAFDRMQARFNQSDNLLIAVLPADGDMFTASRLTALKQLTDAAWQTPNSLRVDSLTNFQHTEALDDDLLVEDLLLDAADLTAEKIEKVRRVALSEPLLRDRLIAKDGALAAVNITVQLTTENQDQQVRDIYQHVAQLTQQLAVQYPDLQFKLAGVIALNHAFATEAEKDATTLVPAMFGAIALMLMLMLRSVLAAVAVVVIILLTIASTLGISGWLGIFLSTATVNVPTLVMTMAVADSVHLIASTQLLLRQGVAKPQAVQQAMQLNAMPVFITSVTTAIGFLMLNFSEVPILRDFGNLVALGVMLAWALTVTVLPAMLMLLPISQGHNSRDVGFFDRLAEWVIERPMQLIIGTVLLTAAGAYLSFQNVVNDEAVKYFSTNTEFRQSSDLIDSKLSGVSTIDLVLDSGAESGVNNPAFIAAVDSFGNYLKSLPEVRHVNQISDVFRRLNQNMHGDDPAYYRLPDDQETAAQYLLMYEMSLPFGLDLNNQLTLDKRSTKVTVTMGNLGSKDMIRLEQQILQWFQTQYPQYQIEAASTALMFAHIGERNMASMLQTLPLAAVLISALLVLSLRSWQLGAISVFPNLIPALLGFGVWQLMSGEINLSLSVITSMSLGIIVDDTVHFLAKYQHARKEGRTAEDAVRYAFHSVGWALVVTTLVLVIGFGMLMLSDFRLNSDMGLLTSVILVLALVVDFLFLPALLLKLDRDKTPLKTASVAQGD